MTCTRHRNLGHATVDQTLSTQFGVHANQNTVGGLSLAGVGGHGLAMINMRIFTRVDFGRSFYPQSLHVVALPSAPTFSSANQAVFTAGVPNSFTMTAGPFVDRIAVTGGAPAFGHHPD